MRSWKTTVSGLVAAFCMMFLTILQEFPSKPGKLLMVACSLALASLGYHAVDCSRCPGDKARRAAAFAVVALALSCAGCAMSGFRLSLTGTPFGSLSVGVGGNAIGNAYSNAVPALYKAPEASQGTTNTLPVKSVGS